MTDLSLVLASDEYQSVLDYLALGSLVSAEKRPPLTVSLVVDPQPERADGLGDTLHRWRWFGPCHYDTDQQLAAAIEQHARDTYEGKDVEVWEQQIGEWDYETRKATCLATSPRHQLVAVVHVVRVVGVEREMLDSIAPKSFAGRWIFTAEVRKA